MSHPIRDLRAIEASIIALKRKAKGLSPEQREPIKAEIKEAAAAAAKLRHEAGIFSKVLHEPKSKQVKQ